MPALLFVISAPLLINELGTRGYGTWTLAISILGLSGLFDFGLSTGLAKFVAQHRAREDAASVSAFMTVGIATYVIVGSIACIALFASAELIAELFARGNQPSQEVIAQVVRLASLGLIPLMVKNGLLAVPIGAQRFAIPAVVSVVQGVLTTGGALAAAYSSHGVAIVVASSVIAVWLAAGVAVVLVSPLLRQLQIRPSWSWRQLGVLARFSSFAAATTLGSVIFSSVDRLLVGYLLGVSSLAHYAIAAGVAGYLLSVADVLARPLMPAASAWSSTGRWELVRTYLLRSTLWLGALVATGATFLVVLSGPLLRLWLGDSFAESAAPTFRILILAYAGIAIIAPAHHIANGSGFPWLSAIGTLTGGLSTILFIAVAAPRAGLIGAAWANMAYWLNAIILVWLVRLVTERIRMETDLRDKRMTPRHSGSPEAAP